MTDLERLRNQWQNIKIETPDAEASGAGIPALEHGHTLTQRILRRYRIILVVTVLGLINGGPFHVVVHPPLWIMIYYIAFLAICGATTLWQIGRLEGTDIVSLPVVEAIRFTERFIQLRRRIRNTQMVFVIPFIVMLIFWLASENQIDAAIGGAIGGIAGAIIGLRMDMKFRHDLQALKRFFGDIPESGEENSMQ